MGADEALAAFDKGFELAAKVSERMQDALAERGLSAAKASVIFTLHHQGPQVQRELSVALNYTPRHITALVDALSEAGFVERKQHPTDRRAVLVGLTARGKAEADRMDNERVEAAQELFGDTPVRQLRTFMAVADRLIEGVQSEP